MPIEPDQPLLHYRISANLGEGGMGVVWPASSATGMIRREKSLSPFVGSLENMVVPRKRVRRSPPRGVFADLLRLTTYLGARRS